MGTHLCNNRPKRLVPAVGRFQVERGVGEGIYVLNAESVDPGLPAACRTCAQAAHVATNNPNSTPPIEACYNLLSL